jgi:hypothetical protein
LEYKIDLFVKHVLKNMVICKENYIFGLIIVWQWVTFVYGFKEKMYRTDFLILGAAINKNRILVENLLSVPATINLYQFY